MVPAEAGTQLEVAGQGPFHERVLQVRAGDRLKAEDVAEQSTERAPGVSPSRGQRCSTARFLVLHSLHSPPAAPCVARMSIGAAG